MTALPIAILGSGKGSNAQALLEAVGTGRLNAEVRLVVTDVESAGILGIARNLGVEAVYLEPGKFRTKLEIQVEEQLVRLLHEHRVELVALAGFMRVLKAPMLAAFPRRIVNIHPSLLPKFPGVAAWRQALVAGESVTGCTVHLVTAEIDAGEILAQRTVPILPNDSAETLHARIQVAERELYPEVIATFCPT